MTKGKKCSPRGKNILELLGTQLVVDNLRANIITDPQRDLNFRFMVAEWLWILAGRNDVATVARYNKPIAAFSDDGVTFEGAYGPRLSSQWEYVIRQLEGDPDSRQAVASIWQPNPPKSKDYPCTLNAQFLIREGKLHSVWTMRSNDLWLGTPYDFFNFSQITNALAGRLKVPTGSMTLNVGSSHVYESNFEVVEKLLNTQADKSHWAWSPLLHAWPRAEVMLHVVDKEISESITQDTLTDEEYFYVDVLRSPNKAAALEKLNIASSIAVKI